MQDKRENTKKNKSKRALVYKPYLKGHAFDGPVIRRALKVLLYYLVFVFLYLIVGGTLQIGGIVVRTALNLALVTVAGALLYMDAAKLGDAEVAFGEIAYARKEAGAAVDEKERERCYHPLKGLMIALAAAVPILVLTLPHAVTATRQYYSLQVLPSWMTSYSNQQEIMAPLQYYEQHKVTLGGVDILHMIGRILTFPFANIVSSDNADGLLIVDRLSPLLACLPLAGYILGYLTGPHSRAIVHGDISSSNKRQQRRKNKALKARQARQAKAEKKNELI